jgi:hypothetical protein
MPFDIANVVIATMYNVRCILSGRIISLKGLYHMIFYLDFSIAQFFLGPTCWDTISSSWEYCGGFLVRKQLRHDEYTRE